MQRWVKFAKYLPKQGWKPVIYAPENADYPAVDTTIGEELPDTLEVIRRPIREPYAIYRKLMGKSAKREVTEISSGKKSWKQRLSLWIRGNLFVPDPRVWWVKPSVRFLKEYLKEHPVDAIVTTGPPHSVHLIGLKLHKALGTPWVPDFRDPWSRMYYLKHLPMTAATWRKLRRQEQAVLDGCSTVLAVTPIVQEEFRAQTKTPVAMITNGYDAEDFKGPAPEPDGFFNITHTGLFAKDGNPFALWKVLGGMPSAFKEKLRIRLVGTVDREVLEAISANGLAQNVVSLGYLDHAAAIKEQRAATILILPLRNDPQYRPILPGKLFEYLAARRPILGIGQTDGAMARVIEDAVAGETVDWDDEAGIRHFLEKEVRPTEGNIEKYTRENLTAELARLLESLL